MDAKHVKLYIDDRPQDRVFRVHRDVFTDPELFELEMKFIFERTWNFIALESQIAKPNDFITTKIGRVPILVTRDKSGDVRAFVNACSHRGARLCRERLDAALANAVDLKRAVAALEKSGIESNRRQIHLV